MVQDQREQLKLNFLLDLNIKTVRGENIFPSWGKDDQVFMLVRGISPSPSWEKPQSFAEYL